MKKTIVIHGRGGAKEQEVNYIPIRFILAILLIVLETASVLAVTMLCAVYIPYFYSAMYVTEIRIILPHIPDKKIVFVMTRSHYKRLMAAGVKMYEFEPGFVHAKVYLADGRYGIVGTINLDYRSLVHHFENGVWLYRHEVLGQMKDDLTDTMDRSIKIEDGLIEDTLPQRLIRVLVRVLSPLL